MRVRPDRRHLRRLQTRLPPRRPHQGRLLSLGRSGRGQADDDQDENGERSVRRGVVSLIHLPSSSLGPLEAMLTLLSVRTLQGLRPLGTEDVEFNSPLFLHFIIDFVLLPRATSALPHFLLSLVLPFSLPLARKLVFLPIRSPFSTCLSI
jgi:hypothetical protein